MQIKDYNNEKEKIKNIKINILQKEGNPGGSCNPGVQGKTCKGILIESELNKYSAVASVGSGVVGCGLLAYGFGGFGMLFFSLKEVFLVGISLGGFKVAANFQSSKKTKWEIEPKLEDANPKKSDKNQRLPIMGEQSQPILIKQEDVLDFLSKNKKDYFENR